MGRWAWSSDAFDFDSDGWEDLYVGERDVHAQRRRDGSGRGQLLLAPRGGRVAPDLRSRARPTTTAGAPSTASSSAPGRRPSTSATSSCATTAREASTRSRAASGSTSTRTAAPSRCSTTTTTAIRTSSCSRPARRRSCASSATTTRDRSAALAVRLVGTREQPRRGGGAGDGGDGSGPRDADRAGGLGVHLAALEGAAVRPWAKPGASAKVTIVWPRGSTQTVSGRAPQPPRLGSKRGARPSGASPSPRRASRRRARGGAAPSRRASPRLQGPGCTSPFPRPTSR